MAVLSYLMVPLVELAPAPHCQAWYQQHLTHLVKLAETGSVTATSAPSYLVANEAQQLMAKWAAYRWACARGRGWGAS
jgi:hypothetical protein